MATTESGITKVAMLAKFTVSSWAVATTSSWAGPFGSLGWQAVASPIRLRKQSSRTPWRMHQLSVDERITRGLVKTESEESQYGRKMVSPGMSANYTKG